MRLGVISDTHGLLRPEVFDIFKTVDHILHGGDVGKWAILKDLEALAPVTAVYGNTDGPELRARLPQVAELELDGFAVVVTHGDQFGHPTPAGLHEAFIHSMIIASTSTIARSARSTWAIECRRVAANISVVMHCRSV